MSAFGVLAGDLPDTFTRRLPRYPILPGILLGRLAVDQRYQGQGMGRRLLILVAVLAAAEGGIACLE